MKKVLFCATVDFHITTFHLPYLKYFKEQGYEVHVAAKGNLEIPFCDIKHEIPMERNPFHINNIEAYKELKSIIEEHCFEIIHCHTPVGGLLGRLAAARMRDKGTKVIYTAHGFHFYKGAPFLNWIIYYPIEKFLSRITDCLITINKEDYYCAKNRSFKAEKILHVNGVGIDCNEFKARSEMEYQRVRKQYNMEEKFVLMYVAELNQNKNQALLIRSVAKLKETIPNIKLILIGQGSARESYEDLAKTLQVEEYVEFLGQRDDVSELLKMCDVYCASSIREGLGINVLEAMATGIPVCAAYNRGHSELIRHGKNGYLVSQQDEMELVEAVNELYQDKALYESLAKEATKSAKLFSIERVLERMQLVYTAYGR